MAKVKACKFFADYCEEGEIRFESGKAYAKSKVPARCTDMNFCEEASVDESELSEPNPTAAERRAAAALAQQSTADVAAQLATAKATLDQATALIDQARALVIGIAEKQVELAAADEATKPAIIAQIGEATDKLVALFA